MEEPISRVTTDMNAASLESDLEHYRGTALEMGASHAAVIKAADIPVDERITLKCRVPRCFGYGVGAHCPPHTMQPKELQDYLAQYEHAVFFTIDAPSEVIVRDRATIKERVDVYQLVYKIVNKIESMAFYDGHYLAFGFGAGSCRHTFCGKMENCQALEGGKCRFSLLSRPSMEAVGIDVFKMMATQGLEIYPIGSDAKASAMPKGVLAGIVIVQ